MDRALQSSCDLGTGERSFIYFGCETTLNSNPGEKKKKAQTQAGQEGGKKTRT